MVIDDNVTDDAANIRTMLCMPIVNANKDVIGVAQLINKVSYYYIFMFKIQCKNSSGNKGYLYFYFIYIYLVSYYVQLLTQKIDIFVRG